MSLHLLDIFAWPLLAICIIVTYVSGEELSVTFSLAENTPLGHVVGNISSIAHDAFSKRGKVEGAIVYNRFFDVQLPQSYVYLSLRLDNTSGVISTSSKPLDRESICNRQVTCKVLLTCARCDTKSANVAFHLIVLDVNDHLHRFDKTTPLSTAVFAEDALPGSKVNLPRATDLDSPANSVISYTAVAVSGFLPFSISTTTGPRGDLDPYLVLNRTLDYELRRTYSFTLQALDKDNRASDITINIKVLNVNDNYPHFLEGPRARNFTENHDKITMLLKVTAEDADIDDNLTFTLSGIGHKKFRITSNGEIYLKSKLHFEDQSRYILEVKVTDDGGLSDSVTLNFLLTDTNDNDPIITLELPYHTYNVSESEVSSRTILYFRTADKDTGDGGKVTCDLRPSDAPFRLSYDMQSYASVNTVAGVTAVSGILRSRYDRETTPTYDMDIVCRDHGEPSRSSETKITIDISDVNDNAPVFSQHVFRLNISERLPMNTGFLKLKAVDLDLKPETRYRFATGSSTAGFRLHSTSGELELTQYMDYETRTSYTLDVIVYDAGNPLFTDSAEIYISVMDADDELPVFSSEFYTMTLTENGNGSRVILGRVLATDADTPPYNQMLYYIEPSDADGLEFTVGERSGVISSTLSADREHKSSYNFRVEARGVVTPANHAICSIEVFIADLNDNAPRFLFPRASTTAPVTPIITVTLPNTPDVTSSADNTVRISPLTPIGTRIARLNATDADLNSSIAYSLAITGDEVGVEFSVDTLTGWVSTLSSFAGVEFARKALPVLAVDRDSPILRTSAILYIVVDSALKYPADGAGNGRSQVVPRRNLVILVAICAAFALLCTGLLVAILMLRARRRRQRRNLRDGDTTSGYARDVVRGAGVVNSAKADPYTLSGYANKTMNFSRGKDDYDDDGPPPFYSGVAPINRRHRNEDEQITNSDSGNGSNDGDVEMVNSPRRLDLSPKSSEISIQFTEGVSPPYSSYTDGDTVVVTERNGTPTDHAHSSQHRAVPPTGHAPSTSRAPNGDIYARPTRLRIASQV